MKALAVFLMLSVLPTGLAASPTDERRFEAVEAVIDETMDLTNVLGASVAIIDDFEVVFAQGFGFAEPGRPVDIETLFQAASLSKPMAAVVAAAADEEGVVRLDGDVAGMLTSWALPPAPHAQTITLRMLFAHRAGINVPGFPGYGLDEPLPELPQILNGVRDKNEPIRVVAEPGAEFEYSGGGYVIAQLAIEDDTGVGWADLADAHVLDALSLELSTYRSLDASQRSRVAVGYREDGTEVAGGGWHLYPESAPASLWTTPTEYAAFVVDVMGSHQDGSGVVLDQATARLLLDPAYPVGFGISEEEGGIAIGHDGANEGYRAGFRALPHLGEGVVVMTNSDAGSDVVVAVIDVVADELGWPWTAWATPLWAVIVALVVFGTLAGLTTRWILRRRHRRLVA